MVPAHHSSDENRYSSHRAPFSFIICVDVALPRGFISLLCFGFPILIRPWENILVTFFITVLPWQQLVKTLGYIYLLHRCQCLVPILQYVRNVSGFPSTFKNVSPRRIGVFRAEKTPIPLVFYVYLSLKIFSLSYFSFQNKPKGTKGN